MPVFEVDAILFDMDGTLVDESQSYREAVRLTSELLLSGPVLQEEVDEIKRLPGFNNDWDATWALVGRREGRPAVPPAETERLSPQYRRLQSVFQTFYLGDRAWSAVSGKPAPFLWSEPLIGRERALIAHETLRNLSDFRLGIATSRPRLEALMALQQHALEPYFDEALLVAQGDASAEKPHPAPLQELVRRMGCKAPVYVGDSINDALAARAADMPFVHIGTEPLSDPACETWVEYRVADVNDIVALFERQGAARRAGDPA